MITIDTDLNLSVCQHLSKGKRIMIFKSDSITMNPNSKLILMKYTSKDPIALDHLYSNTFYDGSKAKDIFIDDNYIPRLLKELKSDPRVMLYWMDNTALSDNTLTQYYWDNKLIDCEIFHITRFMRYTYWMISCPEDVFMTFQIHQYERKGTDMVQTKILRPFKIIDKQGLVKNTRSNINVPFIWNSKIPILDDFIGILERLNISIDTINQEVEVELTSLVYDYINVHKL